MATKPKTSKKPKAAKTADKTEPVKSSEVMKMPSEATVRALARDISSTKKGVGDLNSELSDVIAAAKKDKGVHPGALKRVVALIDKAKKTDRGLAAVATEMAHFDYYCDVLGLTKMLESQGQMFARTEAGEKEDGQGDLVEETENARPGPKFSGPAARDEEPSAVH